MTTISCTGTGKLQVKGWDSKGNPVSLAGIPIAWSGSDNSKLDVAQDWGDPSIANLNAKGPAGSVTVTATVGELQKSEDVEIVAGPLAALTIDTIASA